MALPQHDVDRLTPAALATWHMLAGLREGRTMNEFAERLADVVDGVLNEVKIDENTGKVSGPTGTVTLTLKVIPNEVRPDKFVKVTEKIAYNKPEDRSHVLFVGKGSTVHTRDPHDARTPTLFAVEPVNGGATVTFKDSDTDAPGTGGGPEDTPDEERKPYRDN